MTAEVRPGTLGPIPAEWPEYGTLGGEPIRLAEVESLLPWHERAEVEVEVGGRRLRPWRQVPLLGFDDAGRPTGPF